MRLRVIATRAAVGMLAGLFIGAAISEATYFFLRRAEDRTPRAVDLVIPAGTAARIASGAPEPSIPDSMTFVVGDVLTVHNQDSSNHQLGPLFIPAGSSASLRLALVQKYDAACSFQPSQSFGIDVQPALTFETRALGILQAGLPLGFLFVLYGVFAVPPAKARASP